MAGSNTVWEDSVALFLSPSLWAVGYPNGNSSVLASARTKNTGLSGILTLENYLTQIKEGLG